VKAAFIKEGNLFEQVGTKFYDTFVNLGEKKLLARQLYEHFAADFGLTEEENVRAVTAGYAALDAFDADLLRRGRETLDRLEAEQKIGIMVLARPYHNDPGVNHEILEDFQKLGYPILTQESLPHDADLLDRLFGEEVKRGDIASPLDISDIWKNSYSENTSRKVWAAKFTARIPTWWRSNFRVSSAVTTRIRRPRTADIVSRPSGTSPGSRRSIVACSSTRWPATPGARPRRPRCRACGVTWCCSSGSIRAREPTSFVLGILVCMPTLRSSCSGRTPPTRAPAYPKQR